MKKLSDNFYLRGDGTRCFYFEERELVALFQGHGFSCCNLLMHERDVENRKNAITMHRRWVQVRSSGGDQSIRGAQPE